MNGWPVTPAGSKHFVTDVTVIVVPGGPEVGDIEKVAVAAKAGVAAMAATVNIPRPTAPSALSLLTSLTPRTRSAGYPRCQPISILNRITP